MADDNEESWGWILFWFFGAFLAAPIPPVAFISFCLAIYYGFRKLTR